MSIKKKDTRKRDSNDLGSELDREMYELESLGKIKKSDVPSAKDLTLEEDLDISEYLDTQVTINAFMNNRMKATLDRFAGTHGSPARATNKSIIISENNVPGEEDND